MGVLPQQGSFGETSSQEELKYRYADQRTFDNRKFPPNSTDLVTPHPQYPRDNDTILAREEANDKSFVERTSYDPWRYQETFGTLMQYARGTPIRVTYYRQILPDTGERTAFGDVDFLEHDSHVDLEQILNFEMRPESQFDYSWDNEKNEATFNGEAITYPGFEPHVGDMFVYKIKDSIGLFQLIHVEPMSIRQGAYHKIGFTLRSRLSEGDRRSLINRTKSTVVFDLQKCLSENLALLQYESYIDLERLRETRISLATYYNKRFFDPILESYLGPDGIYDPYLVKYMLMKISTQVTRYRPMQLILVFDYDFTIWSLFTGDRRMPLEMVHPAFEIVNKIDGVFGTQFNGLINRPYIRIINSSNKDWSAEDGLGSRVQTGYMNGQITKAEMGDGNENDDDSNSSKDRETFYVNTQEGMIKRITRDKHGNILEEVTLPPLPRLEEEAYGPVDERHKPIPGGMLHRYRYYYKNVRPDRNVTTFKVPHCGHACPPCPVPPEYKIDDSCGSGCSTKVTNPYIFSWAFYKGLHLDMNTVEKIVYDYITTGVVDPHAVTELVMNFRKLPDEDLYKYGPVYLHLIDVAERSIT